MTSVFELERLNGDSDYLYVDIMSVGGHKQSRFLICSTRVECKRACISM